MRWKIQRWKINPTKNSPIYSIYKCFYVLIDLECKWGELWHLPRVLSWYFHISYMFAHSEQLRKKYVVGMNQKKTAQYLNIKYDTRFSRHIFRMVLQSLGKYYEHQRPDRNHYITIKWNNIAPGTYLPYALRMDISHIASTHKVFKFASCQLVCLQQTLFLWFFPHSEWPGLGASTH